LRAPKIYKSNSKTKNLKKIEQSCLFDVQGTAGHRYREHAGFKNKWRHIVEKVACLTYSARILKCGLTGGKIHQ